MLNQSEAAYLGLHLGFDVISPTIVAKRVAANYDLICIVTLGKTGHRCLSPKAHEMWEPSR